MVSYLQLAHNERHPVTGSPVARVVHNFGRADAVDREALRRLVGSISRFLEPTAEACGSVSADEVEVIDRLRRRHADPDDGRRPWDRKDRVLAHDVRLT